MSVPMKYLVIFSILIAASLSSSFAFANPCEDNRQLKSLWETKYIKLVQNPEALGTRFDRSSMAYKLANAICILEYPGLPNYDGLFYRYLNAMIKSIVIDLDNPYVVSDTIASTAETGILDIHNEFFNDRSDTPFVRTSTLIHEARHTELKLQGKFDDHTICTRGRHKGEPYCDADIAKRWEDATTHAYELFFLTLLYEKSEFYRSNLRIKGYTNDLIDTYFNYVSETAYHRYYKH